MNFTANPSALVKEYIAKNGNNGALIYITKSKMGKPLNLRIDGNKAISGYWPNHLKSFPFTWMLIYYRRPSGDGEVWIGDYNKRVESEGRYEYHLSDVKGPFNLAESLQELVGMRPQRSPVPLSKSKSGISKAVTCLERETAANHQLVKDLKDTESQIEILARLGQGKFRDEVLAHWHGACAVTGCTILEVLRASHVRPWRDSDPSTRLNPLNGLPLIANLDALFDRGLISFKETGEMLVSKRLTKEQQVLFDIPRNLRLPLNAGQKKFLKYHRKLFFKTDHSK